MAPAAMDADQSGVGHLTPRLDSISHLLTMPVSHYLTRRATPAPDYHPGSGSRPPDSFNNKGLFALFGLLGAAMAVASIWFFFWAKNGGFIWRKGDWDDYKSTVLRRKGKDGKTLSNATPATNLGEKSIAGTWDIERDARDDHYADEPSQYGGKKKRPHGHKKRQPSDEDLRAYRKERPARVGGLNKQEDGSSFDPSNASRSDLASESSRRPLTKKYEPPKEEPSKKKGFMEKKREKKAEKAEKKEEKKKQKEQKERHGNEPSARKPSRPRHVFAADETSTIGDPSERYTHDPETYFSAYRPPAPPHAPSRRYEQRQQPQQSARQPSPTKPSGHAMGGYAGGFDGRSEAGSSDTGTKVYAHHIPGLSRGSRDTGFRRGNYGPRRDSLSDSDDNDDLAGFRRR